MNHTISWSNSGTTTTTTTTTTTGNSLSELRAASHRILLLLHKLGLPCRAIPEGMVISSLADNSLYVKTKTDIVRLSNMHATPYNTYSGYAGSGGGTYKVHNSFWSDATSYPAGSIKYTSAANSNGFTVDEVKYGDWVEGTSRLKLDNEE